MIGFNDEGTDAGFVLDCRRRVHDYMLTADGPILVHCRYNACNWFRFCSTAKRLIMIG